MRSFLFIVVLRGAIISAYAEEIPVSTGTVYHQAVENYMRGMALVARKQYPEAVASFSTAVGLNPKFGNAYFWRGVCEFAQDKTAEAVTDFKQAQLNTLDISQTALIHYDLAVLYRKIGNKALSEKEYQLAASMNPYFKGLPINRIGRSTFIPGEAEALSAGALPRPDPRRPPPLGYLLLLNAAIIAGVIAVIMVLRRRAQAKGVPGSLAPIGLEELRRLRSSWTAEEDLRYTQIPRPVKLRSPATFAALYSLPVVYILIMAAVIAFPTIKREAVLWHGIPGKGQIQRKFQVRRATKHGSYLEEHLEYSYASVTGQSLTAETPTGKNLSVLIGQTVPVHYLIAYPGWATLDDDFGFGARQLRVFFWAMSVGIGTSALILLVTLPGIIKARRLLQLGSVVAARIDEIRPGAKGTLEVFFSYEFDGVVLSATSRLTRRLDLHMGQVITALVDPLNPASAMIYQDSMWHVVGPY